MQEADDTAILRSLREEFARLAAEEAKAAPGEADAAVAAAGTG